MDYKANKEEIVQVVNKLLSLSPEERFETVLIKDKGEWTRQEKLLTLTNSIPNKDFEILCAIMHQDEKQLIAVFDEVTCPKVCLIYIYIPAGNSAIDSLCTVEVLTRKEAGVRLFSALISTSIPGSLLSEDSVVGAMMMTKEQLLDILGDSSYKSIDPINLMGPVKEVKMPIYDGPAIDEE